MLAQIQNPVSVFRFNKVLSADQVLGTQEFVVDHLLNTLKGQNWALHWNPAVDATECQILFPMIPDRMTHIRPIANYFQQHFMEDPAVIYRPRNEFIDFLRTYDMNRCAETGGWGLTVMSRLNNLLGKDITEVRTKIVTPTEVIYKYITREAPLYGQLGHTVSPLGASIASPLTPLGLEHELYRDYHDRREFSMFPNNMSPHMMRGFRNLLVNNMTNLSPVGLTAPIGYAVGGSPLADWRLLAQQLYSNHFDSLDEQERRYMLRCMTQMGLPYPAHQAALAQKAAQCLDTQAERVTHDRVDRVVIDKPAQLVSQGLTQAVCQTLNPSAAALCEQQTTSVQVQPTMTSVVPNVGMVGNVMGHSLGSPILTRPMVPAAMIKKTIF